MDKYHEIRYVFADNLSETQTDALIHIAEANGCMVGGGGAELVLAGERIVAVVEATTQVLFAAAAGRLPTVRLEEVETDEDEDTEEDINEQEEQGEPA